jgi:tetratricopeptide (TPR) repeat protein
MPMRRFALCSLVLAACIAGSPMASAQGQGGRKGASERRTPAKLPAPPRPDRAERLNTLYEALKAAPNEKAADALQARIEAMLAQSGSDTADLLMVRARSTIEAKDYDVSLELLDAIIELSPDFTEAYAQRATVHYLKKDLYRSLADLRVVIAREPRHSTALAGLGVILQDIGEEKRALAAYRRAVELHPHIKGIPQLIKRLESKVDGREI